MSKLKGKGTRFGKAFVHAANADVGLPSEVKNEFSEETLLFFRAMQPHGTEFGYRVALEAARFTHFLQIARGLLRRRELVPRSV